MVRSNGPYNNALESHMGHNATFRQADPEGGARIKRIDAAHVFHPRSAQADIDPLVIAGGRGSWFWDYEGKHYLDFASQQASLNIGHQHPRLVAAIQAQVGKLATLAPSFAERSRSEAARLIAELAPGDLNRVFFTNAGAEANENALRMARLHTGRQKVLAAYRSYHGATDGAIAATGESRRQPSEPAVPGVVHYWSPYLYRSPFFSETTEQECERALSHLLATIEAEGPQEIAAIILEPVVGANGILLPPPGYLAGVRALCDEFGIVFIADEVMAGFGRSGEWFSVDRWRITPDLITFAKGATSGYVPLGGVIISERIAQSFDKSPFPGGLTCSGHVLACATAAASINIFREEGIVDNARRLGDETIWPALLELAERHPCIGEVRGLGVFWALELVNDRVTGCPLGADSIEQCVAACHKQGVWPLPEANRIHVLPPCTTTPEEIHTGIAALDKALTVADRSYIGRRAVQFSPHSPKNKS